MMLALFLACAVPSSEPVSAPPIPVEATSTASKAPEAAPAEPDAPPGLAVGASLYALDVPLVDQEGRPRDFAAARGDIVVYSMFYTTCPRACPLLIEDIQSLERGMKPAERERLRVVLISMDPERDTPAALAAVVASRSLDARWTLAVPPADRVREVAAALGVRYRPLPSGGFAHTSVLTAVDAEGRVLARSDGTVGREALEAALHRGLAGS